MFLPFLPGFGPADACLEEALQVRQQESLGNPWENRTEAI